MSVIAKRSFSVAVIGALVTGLIMPSVARGDDAAAWRKAFDERVRPILEQKCSECHRGEEAHGFDLNQFASTEGLEKHFETWEEVGKRVRLNEMPPEGSPGLNDAQKAIVHQWLDQRPERDLCSQLATDETKSWYRGYVMSRRLTRTEYRNAIDDLVGIPIDPSLEIPSDGSGGEGFDTAGDALFTSAIHIEQYLAVADQVISEAIVRAGSTVDPESSPTIRDSSPAIGLIGQTILDSDQPARQRAKTAIAKFTRRAWRRPIQDDEVDRLMQLFDAGIDRGMDVPQATGQAMKAALVSPNFLFVVETESEEGGVQRLTPHQLAMRLSLLIWSSVPDAKLLDAADRGELDTDAQVIAEARRMLADPRSRALGENFGMQWLGLTQFRRNAKPDPELFSEYDATLADDLQEEAVRTVWSVFRDDRPLMELVDADSVHVNMTLANHYRLDWDDDTSATDPSADVWKRVSVTDRSRGGVITMGAVLTSASYSRRTSPVLRGRWVLEEVLGGKVPPPPPGVPALEESVADHAASLREQLELHRKNPECAACHNRMDPLGFGLENFDAIGRWRDSQDGAPIDATGKLPSGETFAGPAELKQVLVRRGGEFRTHFVKKMLGFALGRSLNQFDDCVIRDCLKNLELEDDRASVVLETIVTSYPFQHRFFKSSR